MSKLDIIGLIYISVSFIGLFVVGLNCKRWGLNDGVSSDKGFAAMFLILAWPLLLAVAIPLWLMMSPMWLGERVRKHLDRKKNTGVSEK